MSSPWRERCLPWRLSTTLAPTRALTQSVMGVWKRTASRFVDSWCAVCRKVTVRVRNDTGKIPFGHGASLVRWGHTVEEGVLYAPTQWTVSCDAGGAFGAVSSCYPLKCTMPSLTFGSTLASGWEWGPVCRGTWCKWMEGSRTVLPFAHRLHVTRHAPRILSVGVFFHGLF